MPAPDTNGHNGWRVLGRRARGYAQDVDTSRQPAPVTFPKQLLHPRILEKAWPAYMHTDFDNAAFEAMKAVEIAVRDAAGYGPEKIGVNLIQDAFSQGKGPLTDTTTPPAEQVSRMNLFWGAIGSYKNPQSHRDVNAGCEVGLAHSALGRKGRLHFRNAGVGHGVGSFSWVGNLSRQCCPQ